MKAEAFLVHPDRHTQQATTETFLVKANRHTQQTITCGIMDQLLKGLAVPVGFFYRESVDRYVLINALKEVLSDFPIFAGTLKTINSNLCIDCNNQGVLVSVKRENCTIDEVLVKLQTLDRARLINRINPRTVALRQSPVLTIQLTYFACGGMVMGICWHHAIGDMHTFMQFMQAWSNAVNKKQYPLPFIPQDRDQYLQKNLEHNENAIPSIKYLSTGGCLGIVLRILLQLRDQTNLQFYFSENELTNMKQAFRGKTGKELSTNDALCTHLFSIFSELDDRQEEGCFSLVINYRSRVGLPQNVLGNFVSSISIPTRQQVDPFQLAQDLRAAIDNFQQSHLDFFPNKNYIESKGGIKKIHRFLGKSIDPQKRSMLVTNWANFGVYDLTFKDSKPFYFSYFGDSPLAWLSGITEGFSNRGLIYNIALPSKLAKALVQADNLQKIHQHRDQKEVMPAIVRKLAWLL